MHRGTVRPRSPSDPDSGDIEQPRHTRQKHSQSQLEATHSDSHRTTSTSPVQTRFDMGHEMNTGTGATHGSEPGPSTLTSSNGNGNGNGHSSLPPTIKPVSLPGRLMYQDDEDWAMYQDLPEDTENVQGGMEVEDAGAKRRRRGAAAAKRMPIEREEIVRLILQGLRDIGYDQSADTLESESGYQLSTQPAADFQAAIMGGRWSEAIQLLDQLGIPSDTTVSSEPESSSSSIASGKTKASAKGTGSTAEKARFFIAQQKYLEYLELGQQKKALSVLRGELAHLTKDSDILHSMSGYMMCLDKDDLYERAGWDGAAGTSRRQLLEKLQSFISPSIMVPSRRLATLLDQARRHQQQTCLYHDDGGPSSLYVDHECSSGQFPSVTTHILADHSDEVWNIVWSPDGMMLASHGKDHTVVIWKLTIESKDGGGNRYSLSPLHHLKQHRDEVDSMAWSPDSKTLVTAAFKSLYIWDVKTGTLRITPSTTSQHDDSISAIQWMPDGSEFIVASMDCKLIFYGPTGTVRRAWSFNTLQVTDFIVTPDQKSIIAGTTSLKRVAIDTKLKQAVSALDADNTAGLPRDFGYGAMEHNLVVIRLGDKEITDWSQDLKSPVTSLNMSWDKKRILLSCGAEVQMWNLHPQLKFMRRFTGHVHSRYLIRSGFGATKDRFVLSGSEDGHVYVWQSNTGQTIEVLGGHSDSVNAVAWNPIASRRIFASCSDDLTIRIWQTSAGLTDSEMDGMVLDADADANTNGKAVEEGNGKEGEVGVETETDTGTRGMVL